MFTDTIQWTIARQCTSGQRPSQGQVVLQLSISRKTLQKMLNSTWPQGQHKQLDRPVPLGPWIPIIDRIVKENELRSKSMQVSPRMIWQYLCKEHDFKGSFSMVNDYVRQARSIAALDVSPVRELPGSSFENRRLALKSPPAISGKVIAPSLRISNRELENRAIAEMVYHADPSRQNGETQDQAFQWMRGILQGTIPFDAIASEMTNVPPSELKLLVSTSTEETLPVRNKAIAVLGRLRGIDHVSISSFLNISQGTFWRYWRLFKQGGTKKLFARRTRSDKKSVKDSNKKAVFALLHSPPAAHGINRTTWRMEDLRYVLTKEGYPMCCDTIRTIIKEAGWKWRHARVVLTSNDPEYRVKVDAIKKILSELKPDEAFFSIDEYGPFAIKEKGGVKRVAPGEAYAVPQWQKSKGWVILTAALELSRNQVTHFYSRKKNTNEMIKMADILRDQYRTCSTIYLSWDAASWHVSKDLIAHLDKINQKGAEEGFPVVKTAPLPACAQFLNVIESVFSGMARAIIHNSDYPSVEAAMDAIDRYIKDRNEYFSTHHQRAGKKIWGKERVPSLFEEGQNCKDPLYQYPI
jgi:hypothetical protein